MSRVRPVVCASLLAAASLAAQGQPARIRSPIPSGLPPSGSGAHFVSVDAYPTRDGRPITGLTAGGLRAARRQQAADHRPARVHRAPGMDAARRPPRSQLAARRLRARAGSEIPHLRALPRRLSRRLRRRPTARRVPISETLDRMIGPQDLFGVLTPAQTVKDLMLGQLTQTIQEQLAKHPDWGLAGMERAKPEPGEAELEFAYPREGRRLIAIRRLDKVYSDLEALTDAARQSARRTQEHPVLQRLSGLAAGVPRRHDQRRRQPRQRRPASAPHRKGR